MSALQWWLRFSETAVEAVCVNRDGDPIGAYKLDYPTAREHMSLFVECEVDAVAGHDPQQLDGSTARRLLDNIEWERVPIPSR